MNPTHTLTLYKAADGWRWRLQARNGRIVADNEAHPSRSKAKRAAMALPLDWSRVKWGMD